MYEIEAPVRPWAVAVYAGDLDTAVEDHADDIAVFDVPPPDEGVRGLAASHNCGRRSPMTGMA